MFEYETKNDYDYVIGIDEAGRGPLAGPLVVGGFCFKNYMIDNYPWIKFIDDSKKVNSIVRENVFKQIENADHKIDISSVLSSTNTIKMIETENYIYCYVISSPDVIDKINILNATLCGMSECAKQIIKHLAAKNQSDSKKSSKNENSRIDSLKRTVFKVYIDGNKTPPDLTNCDASAFFTKNEETEISIEENMILVEAVIKGDSKITSISAASFVAKVIRDNIMRELDQKYPIYNFASHKGYPTSKHRNLLKKYGPCFIHRLSFEPCYSLIENKIFSLPAGRTFKKKEKKNPKNKLSIEKINKKKKFSENLQKLSLKNP